MTEDGSLIIPEGEPFDSEEWLSVQRNNVLRYLKVSGIIHGKVPLNPAWATPPYISLWKIAPTMYGQPPVWVISGDLPTDFFEERNFSGPRAVLSAFGDRWVGAALCMVDGNPSPDFSIGDPNNPFQQKELGLYLKKRAQILLDIVDDNSLWPGA